MAIKVHNKMLSVVTKVEVEKRYGVASDVYYVVAVWFKIKMIVSKVVLILYVVSQIDIVMLIENSY